MPEITLEAQATRQATSPLTGRRAYRKGLQTFEWVATDPDDNRLLYQVRYRNEGKHVMEDIGLRIYGNQFLFGTLHQCPTVIMSSPSQHPILSQICLVQA